MISHPKFEKGSKLTKSLFDVSEKKVTFMDLLTKSIGKEFPKTKSKTERLAGPWRHDFKNNCINCNRAFHLQVHHITYTPPITVFLCKACHDKITLLNKHTAATAGTSLEYKLAFTNRVRVIIWRWFLANPWPDNTDLPLLIKQILYKTKQVIPRKKNPRNVLLRGCDVSARNKLSRYH